MIGPLVSKLCFPQIEKMLFREKRIQSFENEKKNYAAKKIDFLNRLMWLPSLIIHDAKVSDILVVPFLLTVLDMLNRKGI